MSNEHASNGTGATNGNGTNGANAPPWDLWQRYALLAGGIGLGIFIAVGVIVALADSGDENSKRQFFVTYLAAWTFWLSLPVGCMGLLGIQYITGASWGVLLGRLFEASCRTLPLLAALFVVIALSLASPATSPYPWSKPPSELTQSPSYVVELKEKFDDFCNAPGFLIRMALYFVLWYGFMHFQNKWSQQVEQTDDRKARRLVENLGGPMVVLFALMNMFAVTDLIMSLELTFSSTMFPLIYSINQLLICFCFCVALFLTLAPEPPLKDVLRDKFQIDMGSFMLGLTLIWCYMNYSQYMLIWIGNLPEEIVYYKKRINGGWQYLTYFQVICHFAMPFVLLLFRDVKLHRKRLRAMAMFILFCCSLDVLWWVEPTYSHGGVPFYLLMDVAAFAGIGGIWVWAFLGQLKKYPLLPTNYLGQLPEATMHTDHDAPNGDVNPESVKQGHEADVIDVRTILYVPIVLIISFALTWGVVTLIINNIRLPSKEPNGNQLAADRNKAPLPDRLARTSSTDPNAEVKQPRLEGAERLTTKTEPWVQSSDPAKVGNSPKYHPEDLRPSGKRGKELGLDSYSWSDKEKKLMRIPIEEAIKILVAGDKLKSEDAVNVGEIRSMRPKSSNPFWGMKPATQEKH